MRIAIGVALVSLVNVSMASAQPATANPVSTSLRNEWRTVERYIQQSA